MKNLDLSTLDIKILLKCNEKPLSMSNISNLYKPFKKEERTKALNFLITSGYIEMKKVPKPNTRKSPTYYLITVKGEEWIKEYLNLFSEK